MHQLIMAGSVPLQPGPRKTADGQLTRVAWWQTLFLVSNTARKNQKQSLTPSLPDTVPAAARKNQKQSLTPSLP